MVVFKLNVLELMVVVIKKSGYYWSMIAWGYIPKLEKTKFMSTMIVYSIICAIYVKVVMNKKS